MYLNISVAILKKVGAAVSEPNCDELGSVNLTNITNFGSSAGAKPIKLAIVFSGS